MISDNLVKRIQEIAYKNASISRNVALQRFQRLEHLFKKKDANAFKKALTKKVPIRFDRKTQNDFRNISDVLIENFTSPTPYINAATNKVPSKKDILKDLSDLKTIAYDIYAVSYDDSIIMITNDIVLEDVNFGKFKVYLNIDDLNNTWVNARNNLRVYAYAQTPNFSRRDSDELITHPHIRDNILCKGDAGHPIANALAQSRIFDYFALVNAVISNYSSNDPYMHIDAWKAAETCSICETEIDEDALITCEDCQSGCNNCLRACDYCGTYICQEHYSFCSICDAVYCSVECHKRCSDCGTRYCQVCVNSVDCCDEQLCIYCARKHSCDRD